MAKNDKPQSNEESNEQPPVTIETVHENVPVEQAKPLTQSDLPSGMVGSVVDSAIAAASDDSTISYIFNENTRELRQVTTRAGYASAPMPFGFRVATPDEIATHKGA